MYQTLESVSFLNLEITLALMHDQKACITIFRGTRNPYS
jgi:hypothetical protein